MFYVHKRMADGHLNKCKNCAKKDVHKRYDDPISRKKIVEYERKRFQNPERKKMVLEYQRKRRIKSPGKYKARQKVSNAIRDGRLIRKPCEICGDPKSQAHHDDYRKYLEVNWYCRKHHLKKEGKKSF